MIKLNQTGVTDILTTVFLVTLLLAGATVMWSISSSNRANQDHIKNQVEKLNEN